MMLVRRSRLSLLVALCLAVAPVFAQNVPADSAAQAQKFPSDWTLGLSVVSTNALPGLDVAARIAPRFDVRLGYFYFDHKVKRRNIALGQSAQLYNMDVTTRFSNITLLADFLATRNGKIRLTAGVGYFFDNWVSAYAETADSSQVYDVTLSPEEVGHATAKVTFASKINPYIGLTFFRVIPKRRWSCSVDVGTFYKGKPSVDIEGTGLLSENDRNEEPFERNINSRRWWPVLAVRIGYKL